MGESGEYCEIDRLVLRQLLGELSRCPYSDGSSRQSAHRNQREHLKDTNRRASKAAVCRWNERTVENTVRVQVQYVESIISF
jgi:hypothetical protein